jgi:BlaI family penicillinase repressor
MIVKRLSGLEQLVMDYIWSHPGCTADACREALAGADRALKESTVRTLLHRLEKKGYVSHAVEGRTYLYSASRAKDAVAAHAVKQIIDRFCGGSVEQLLVGMVDNEFLDSEELSRLVKKISLKRKERK